MNRLYFVIFILFATILHAQDSIIVSNVNELELAVIQANNSGNTVIILENGTYNLNNMLWISGNSITFCSLSGLRDSVIISGEGMYGSVSHIFNVPGSNFTAKDITIGWVANHAIQIHGNNNADNPHIQNVRFVDTYEQMLKGSYSVSDTFYSDSGIVEGCLFEYTAGIGPQWYIGGIDIHHCKNWIVRDNVFKDIRSPETNLSEHAIHFWSESKNTLVERNIIINCDRGIGFGLGNSGHYGGIIRNNMVYTTRDVGIGLENSCSTKVFNNTVYTENYFNSIEYRFTGTFDAIIINNLTNEDISSRNGGQATVSTNVTDAVESWFVNATNGDLHLNTNEPSVIDQGQTLSEVLVDIDNQVRPQGNGYEIGADEIVSGSSVNEEQEVDLINFSISFINEQIVIELALSIDENLKVEIYDILGRKIITPFNSLFRSGNYNLGFNISELVVGKYLLKLTMGTISKTKCFNVF